MTELKFTAEDFIFVTEGDTDIVNWASHPQRQYIQEVCASIANARLQEMLKACPRAKGDKTVNDQWYFCEDR